MSSDDPNNPAVVKSVTSDVEAAVIVNALAAHGIEASTTGGFTSGFRAEAPGDIDVVVRQSDLERAKQILEEIRDEE